MKKITRQFILVFVYLLATPVVQATVVTWELHNVRFDDDGTASGSFTLDDQVPGFLKDFDITTTSGSTNPPFHYTLATTAGAVNKILSTTGILIGQGSTNQLQLSATSPLLLGSASRLVGSGDKLVTSGSIRLDMDPSREWLFPDDIFRHVRTGFLTAVPEPSQIGFFVSGVLVLAGIGLIKRRY